MITNMDKLNVASGRAAQVLRQIKFVYSAIVVSISDQSF